MPGVSWGCPNSFAGDNAAGRRVPQGSPEGHKSFAGDMLGWRKVLFTAQAAKWAPRRTAGALRAWSPMLEPLYPPLLGYCHQLVSVLSRLFLVRQSEQKICADTERACQARNGVR